MPSDRYFDDYTVATTYAAVPLGSRAIVDAVQVPSINSSFSGELELQYVYNDEASTAFALGDLIVVDSDYAPFDGIVSGTAALPKGRVLGFAIGAIAAGSYGWVVVRGVCFAKGDGSVAQGESIVSHTSGQVDTMASAEEEAIIGTALADDGSAGETFLIRAHIY